MLHILHGDKRPCWMFGTGQNESFCPLSGTVLVFRLIYQGGVVCVILKDRQDKRTN